MPVRLWEFLKRHSLLTLAVATVVAALIELLLFPETKEWVWKWLSERQHQGRIVLILFSIWIALFLGVLLWRFLKWNLAPSTYKERQELLQLVVQVLGGVIILFGVYATWKNLQIVQDNFKLAQDGQLSERFTKAIDQIGKDVPQTRLGGMYALIDIAESHNEYYEQVVQVLSAYVRINSAWPPVPKSQEKTKPEDKSEIKGNSNNRTQVTKSPEGENLATNDVAQIDVPIDIQAILTFIGKYPVRLIDCGKRPDGYRKVNLSKTNLYNANLLGTKSQPMNLESVNFREIHTNQANFTGALLKCADFQKSVLLESTIFTTAVLDGAVFTEATMPAAILVDAQLKGTVFVRAHLEDAQFGVADLAGAQLDGALIPGADLQNVKNLTQRQVDSACTDERTKLPKGYHFSSKKIVKRGTQTYCE